MNTAVCVNLVKETAKRIAHVHMIYSPNVECIHESLRLTMKTNKYVSIVTTYGAYGAEKKSSKPILTPF